MAIVTESPRFWTVGRLALAAGACDGLAVVLTLGDPGITIDEPLDVRPGRTYVATLRAKGWRFFDRDVVDAVFHDNAEHPPLGRWLLGIASTLGEPFEAWWMGGPDPVGLYLHAGRLAPAVAFAILVGLIVRTTGRRSGRAAGVVAGFALAAMPRVFAHAHLGALDTFVCLFWTLALLSAERALEHRRPIVAMAGAGIAWALALLTKIHGWFLIPLVLAWAFVRLGSARAIAALISWAATGLALFILGWPWLWYDAIARLKAYWGTGVDRIAIRVQYFGQVFAAREVPWHYPWFYFAVTVPVGLHALGLLALWRGLARPPCGPVPTPAGRRDRAVPHPVQHSGAGLRRRAPVPAGLPPLGPPDRAGIRDGLAADRCPALAPGRPRHPRARAGLRRGRDPSVRPELLQPPGRRPAGRRAPGPGVDLLG